MQQAASKSHRQGAIFNVGPELSQIENRVSAGF
jgi:hypothetical protein